MLIVHEENRALSVLYFPFRARTPVGKSTLRKPVAWLDDGRQQQAAPVPPSKASGSAGVATRRVAHARERRFGRRPRRSRPASEPELSDMRRFRGGFTLGVHKVPFLEFSPRELIKLFCSKIADSRQVLVADRPKICVRHLVPLLEFNQFPIRNLTNFLSVQNPALTPVEFGSVSLAQDFGHTENHRTIKKPRRYE
jgi:hypothetical protein